MFPLNKNTPCPNLNRKCFLNVFSLKCFVILFEKNCLYRLSTQVYTSTQDKIKLENYYVLDNDFSLFFRWYIKRTIAFYPACEDEGMIRIAWKQ